MNLLSVYITFPDQKTAKGILDFLIAKRCIACSNTFPMESAYWWKDNIQQENEVVSIVKTIPAQWNKLVKIVEDMHPYEVPCIIKYEVEANPKYEAWVRSLLE